MNIRHIIALALLATTFEAFSQKLYIWCPKEQLITPRVGFLENEEIDIVFFDARLLTTNSKNECTAEETIKYLSDFIKNTYPSAIINLIDSKEYFKDPKQNGITIKIGIAAHHAAFGADIKVGIGSIGGNFSWGVIPEGKWNAVTGYNAIIYDYRENKEQKIVKEIAKIASRPNTGGYITAKNILNKTYMEANQDLLFFIDNTFMK